MTESLNWFIYKKFKDLIDVIDYSLFLNKNIGGYRTNTIKAQISS